MCSGLTRGLVAVVLYYDGRKAVVQSLRYLIGILCNALLRSATGSGCRCEISI